MLPLTLCSVSMKQRWECHAEAGANSVDVSDGNSGSCSCLFGGFPGFFMFLQCL